MSSFTFKTEPRAYQLEVFNNWKHLRNVALFLEPGLGKSKISLDIACWNYQMGNITRVFILAPNIVHCNWALKEIPTHTSFDADIFLWQNNASKAYLKSLEQAINTHDKLIFFVMNIEAVVSDKGKLAAKRFISGGKTLFILDESSRIKSNKALRTKSAIMLGRYAQRKIILSGTSVTQGPFDLYSQFKFLNPEILNNQTYTAFKHEYGIFEKRINSSTNYAFDHLLQYRNLDKLKTLIEPYTCILKKEDCLDLPEKIPQHYVVPLTTQQRYHYDNIRENLITEIEGKELTAPIILTKLLRLQQITGGFITLEDQEVIQIDEELPKMKLILEILESRSDKVIIWAAFKAEIYYIVKKLRDKYGHASVVEMHGDIVQEDRYDVVKRFQENEQVRFFVGNAKTGGIGLTLTAASTMIYYSNTFSLESRIQSEDRAHRIGQKKHVTYIDIEAQNTLDRHIIESLRSKQDIAKLITGESFKKWL